jgi:2-polyprenyl-3-methyl-5-hydroxy-6-metoxy-1,4-benzoquinol methylase
VIYAPDEMAADVVAEIDDDYVLVVTDPLLLASTELAPRLRDAFGRTNVPAIVPVSNVPGVQAQQHQPPLYLTLRELQSITTAMAQRQATFETVRWDRSDPGLYFCTAALLDDIEVPLRFALQGLDVAISANDYVHRWGSLRGQTRLDLLERIGTDARSILEFGCGEAPLGEALKRRQPCRVVGVEIDAEAAAVAEKRIDAVFRGDVRQIVDRIEERFDFIVGGDIVEHLDEPWSFLSDLRRIAVPGARLLLSMPNLANASVVGDLLRGRFDYVYMGITCVGHLRFFTRRTMEEMLTIAGWEVVEIAPQHAGTTADGERLVASLESASIPVSRDDLIPTGYYVLARNPS